jgi:hypothetical protein
VPPVTAMRIPLRSMLLSTKRLLCHEFIPTTLSTASTPDSHRRQHYVAYKFKLT